MLNLDVQYEEGLEEEMNDLYVFAGFMKPGRQWYAVAYPDSDDAQTGEGLKYYTHKMVVPHRVDDVSHFVKEMKISKVVRKFIKE